MTSICSLRSRILVLGVAVLPCTKIEDTRKSEGFSSIFDFHDIATPRVYIANVFEAEI